MDLFAFNSLLFLLSFIGSCAGEAVLPEGPVDVILGKNATIQTLLNKPTYTFIIWYFVVEGERDRVATVGDAGLNVAPAWEGRVSINKDNGFLSLASVKSEDSGDYSISIITADGSARTGDIQLRVLEPVSAVAIKSNLPEALEHNSTVVLTCSAKGSFLKFTWINGTTPILADGKKITVKDEELSSQLTIAGVLRSDLVGPIYCLAANKLETEKSAPFNLTVYYGPDEVTITPAKPPQFLQAGTNFSLSCASHSSPPATFTWHYGQKAIENPGAVLTLKTIEKLGLGKKAEDYTCRANNAKTGRTISSPVVSFAVLDPILGAKVTGPTGTLIAGNSTANLSCEATSGTVKTRTWTKDGQPLTASSRIVFSSDMSSVMINPLQKEDNGEFMCVLSNPVNQNKALHKMVVNYGPDSVQVDGEKAVEVNELVTIMCAAPSIPAANITWKFNGTLTSVTTAKYVIEKAVYKNSGTYTCEAQNPLTMKTMKATHTLSVKEEGALDEGLSDGAIAGIVIAILVALCAAIALIMYCRQKVPVESPY
ncbi:carcinoembryonic antigen-related cell adhesion molecule 5-like [Cheilinus undulatus]|uniref:carcinoembryonic antigen-related cell adhesion molecule 5-like n=1 Tax=Cheilinus undulatus TaxID=241271 RepID=UPI001BD5C69B|nr:carcinoembryonic antigen-related cell adhesion molecule 5-like [Cheilinus undulatus]